MRTGIALIAAALVLAGCTTHDQTKTARTATEQMLVSTAIDRAADKFALGLPAQSRVFLDTTNFEGTDGKYAIAALRDAVMRQGLVLVDARDKADVVLEARAGALATDQSNTVLGIPETKVPLPLTDAITIPELALYGNDQQIGIAKFVVTAVDAKTGQLLQASGPQYGFAHNSRKTLLIFFGWTENDAYPPEYKNGRLHGTGLLPNR